MSQATPTASADASSDRHTRPPISAAARRWSSLWSELDFNGATLLGRARHVKADRYGLHVELVPQLFDLHRGRRFITVGIKYDSGPGAHRQTGSVGFGQFLNLAFADWAIADRLWDLLQDGEAGVSFQDLDVIDGNFDGATKAADQYRKDRWIQKVWELKVRLEEHAAEHTRATVREIGREVEARPDGAALLARGGVPLPSSLLGPDEGREARTRFRINQGMYGDHTYFIDRPSGGRMKVHGIPPATMFQRASELREALTEHWLGQIAATLDELVELTRDREGAALALAIESAAVARKLNVIVETFWSMWSQPMFSANAEFEVVTDRDRRAAKYMDLVVQRTLRILLKQAIEGIGLYPYGSIDRFNYWTKVRGLQEALGRASRILQLYAEVTTVPAFREANRERNRLVEEFQQEIVRGGAGPAGQVTARA